MYHSVSNNPEFFTVKPADFEWQIKYLYENKYNVIALSQLVEKKIPKNSIVITFDDGYEDNFTFAYPILKKYNFPATIFLTTGRIGDKNYTNKRGIIMPMLDWQQLRVMHSPGLIDFEPHTVSHPKLGALDPKEADREIRESKEVIEKGLGKSCQSFAYPYGNFNQEVREIAKPLFKLAVSVKPGFVGKSDNAYELKRNSIDSLTTRFTFKLKI